jgi:copper(I)-binding protein
MEHSMHHTKHHIQRHSMVRRLGTHMALTALASALALAMPAQAHITLPPGGAHVATAYKAAFRVGHACAGAQSTTGITLRAPAGLHITDVPPHDGWTVQREGQQVRWAPNTPANALPASERTTFVVNLALPDKPTTLWFKVLQQCDKGQADWAEVPGVDGAADKPAFPAARLDVLPRGAAAVDAKLPWVRPTVAGQSATGMFVKLSAPSGARLVGASTPLAETVEVHMMKMEDNIMRMRALPDGLDLPAGQTVELAPGGYHLMLFKPRQAMPAGSTVPITLTFRDPDGKTSSMTIHAPVRATPPEAPAPMHGQPDSAPGGMAPGMVH